MVAATSSNKWTFYKRPPWPGAYDVVWCRWPAEDEPDGFKERPGLIRFTGRDKAGNLWIDVAYGTSKVNKDFVSSFWVENLAHMDHAGLYQRTRFELGLTIRMPWCEELFVPRPQDGVGPIIGRLTEVDIYRLQQLQHILKSR